MWSKSLKFAYTRLLIVSMILAYLVSGCGGSSETEEIRAGDVDVRETDHVTEREVQFRDLENCDGSVEYTQTISQEQSVNKSSNISVGGSFGASGLRVIEAAIDAKYEISGSEGRTAGDRIDLVAPPGTHVRYTIVWVWVVHSGNVTIKGDPDPLDYRYRRLVEVSTSPEDLGCEAVVVETVPTAQTSAATPIPQSNPADLREAVSEYLAYAIQAEIKAYSTWDTADAEKVFIGQPLENMLNFIAQLSDDGLYYVPEFDSGNSYYHDIRRVDETRIEVDSCEIWTGAFYQLSDRSLWGTRERQLVPQTITIEYLGNSWYISNVEFYEPPSFCQSGGK